MHASFTQLHFFQRLIPAVLYQLLGCATLPCDAFASQVHGGGLGGGLALLLSVLLQAALQRADAALLRQHHLQAVDGLACD